jgi:hypothetical protein
LLRSTTATHLVAAYQLEYLSRGLEDSTQPSCALSTQVLKPVRSSLGEGKYGHINFKPPESVASAARRGLELRKKASPSNKGGLDAKEAAKEGVGSGVQRAVNLKNRDELSPEVVKRMKSFLSRSEEAAKIDPDKRDKPYNDKG